MKIARVAFLVISITIIGFCAIKEHFLLKDYFFVLKDYPPFASIKYSESGDGSVGAYFINLDKSIDRLTHITPLVQKLNVKSERIAAVYGKELSSNEKEKLVDRCKCNMLVYNNVGDGVIGCYLSHIKTWQTFLESEHSYALVLEDDADFDPKDMNELIPLLIEKNEKWDLVNIDTNNHGSPKVVSALGRRFTLVKFRSPIELTSCYLINRTAAIKLLKKALPILMPIDWYFTRHWEFGFKLRGVRPEIAKQQSEESDIDSQERRFTKLNANFWGRISSGLSKRATQIAMFINAG
ncbi:MAG: glycosyltransferase family 25 protein [Holosporales bacterium]|nr:glycosyltransferase family 25 protein [Holosporales bacterium]